MNTIQWANSKKIEHQNKSNKEKPTAAGMREPVLGPAGPPISTVAATTTAKRQQAAQVSCNKLTIIRQFTDLQLFFKMFTPINAAKNLILIMFPFTLDIPHMWLSLRFLLSFYLLKGFFLVVFPYSC